MARLPNARAIDRLYGCDFEGVDSQAALPMPRRSGTQPISTVATVGMVADMVRQLAAIKFKSIRSWALALIRICIKDSR